MTVTLTNTTRRLAVFLLPHDSYCAACGNCVCTRRSDGVMLAGALTLPSARAVAALPDAILQVPSIKRALRCGELRAERQAPAPSNPSTEVADERGTAVVKSRRR